MIPLRLVLDTNVIVSAALKPDGIPRTVLLVATTKPARLYVSDEIMSEYRAVLARRELKIRKGLRLQFLQLIKKRSSTVKVRAILRAAKEPEDDKFLECADAARADYLVTRNLNHFPRFWKKTKVITPAEFITIVAPHFVE